MEVSRLAISASKRGNLISAGYTSLSSLSTVSSSHLAQELNISKTEADEILKLAVPNGKLESTNGSSQAIVSGGQTAWEMLKEVENLKCITTSCAALDNILGGGINCKEVTEIGGVPGIGKTQLGIQLAINVQLPHEHGGLAAKAIYIDTEGSFMVERALQIAEACLSDSYELSRKGFHAVQPIRQPKDLLENIYYFRVCSYTEQIALINYLGKFIKEQKNVGGQTAWEMLKEVENLKCITTSCAALDNILGGGINCKEVTEIGGVPGIGKTQLGIQLAINVQLPHEHGGLAAKAIYIDTEGSFMVERALQIAEACLSDSYELSRKGFHAAQPIRQPQDLLENIYYFRVCSYTEQIALINYLGKFIKEQKNVKIVIVDSITFHFRQDFEDMALRTRLLSGLALKLMKLANDFRLAVVLLNQVTTKYSEGSVHLTLALGDSWSHACTNRVILHWNGNERYAHLDKSPTLQSSSAPYSVTGKGIRDSVSEHKKARMI